MHSLTQLEPLIFFQIKKKKQTTTFLKIVRRLYNTAEVANTSVIFSEFGTLKKIHTNSVFGEKGSREILTAEKINEKLAAPQSIMHKYFYHNSSILCVGNHGYKPKYIKNNKQI